MRVLVVDRHRQVLDALADLVTDTPALRLVAAVTSVGEAVPLVRSLRPDVLLIDVDRLSDHGERAVSEIRTSLPTSRMVALSSHHDPATAARACANGFDECVHKGVAVAELLRRYTER